jgi:hypothetical protein
VCDKKSDVVRGDLTPHPQYSIDCSSIEHLSEGTLGTLPEDGNVMLKHAEAPYIIIKMNE